jgi:signal transduction histidine kinase
MVGRKLDFHAGDVSLTDSGGRKLERPFDLHPHVIQKFEIHNAVGCGLFDGDQALGRILLVNRAGGVGNSQLQRLRTVAPFFLDVVRGLLLVRRAEHDAYEREHVRIAHDLHDGPLQSIISFEMRLRIIRKLKERDPVKADQEFDALCDISGKLVAEMRTFVHRTRAIEDDDSTLGASARRLVETFQKDSGVAVSMPGEPNGDWSVPRELGSEVLKIAREALHNVYKHAQATHVLFSLEKKQDQLELAVDDNGSGCPFGGRYSLEELDALQLGPKTIKRRVRALGGAMTLESTPGQGTSVRVSVPLS